jgi:hypothetical protein
MDMNSVNDYLNGDLFDGGLTIKVAEPEKHVLYRLPFLESIVRNKRIIHVGCVDHLELINYKIIEKNWLHKILCDSSSKCVGIDINKQGIDYLIQNGFTDVHYHDIIEDEVPSFLQNYKWDYMILGEILEHIDNPVLFLLNLRKKYSEIVSKFIITVPNAYTYMNLISLTRNVEIINSDHRYWFTPYTLGKICVKSGFRIDSYFFARKSQIKSILPFKKLVFRILPVLRDTIIMILYP